jgi:hypothetical protein
MKKLFSRIILTSLSFVFVVGFQEAKAFGKKMPAAPQEIVLPKMHKVSDMTSGVTCTAKLGALDTIKSIDQFSNRESCLKDHGAKNQNFVAAAKKSHKTFWCANDGLRTQLKKPEDIQRLRDHCNLMHDTFMADEYANTSVQVKADKDAKDAKDAQVKSEISESKESSIEPKSKKKIATTKKTGAKTLKEKDTVKPQASKEKTGAKLTKKTDKPQSSTKKTGSTPVKK